MSNENLKPLETAARIYCEKAGIDADEPVPVPHPLGLAIPMHAPRWTLEAERLLDLSMMLTSIREAGEQKMKIEVVR